MFNAPHVPNLRQILPWLFVVSVGIVYIWHFDNTNNDFQVFYRAGQEFHDGINPWNTYLDSGAYYLNGASTLLLLSGLSLFSLDTAILILRISNLLIIFIVIMRCRDFFRHVPPALVMIFILLAFPFRSAMEYGQLTIIFGSIAFLTLIRIWNNSADSFSLILGLALVVDFKPHLVIGLIVYLMLLRRFSLLIKSFFAWSIFQIAIGIYLNIFPFGEMIHAISFRSGTVAEGEDSFSLISFMNLNSSWSTIIPVLAILMFSVYSYSIRKNFDSRIIPLISFSLLITPLLHPTDLMFLLLVFVVKEGFTNVGTLIMGMFFVWSPQLSGAAFTFIVILTSVAMIIFLKNDISIRQVILIFIPNVAYLLLITAGVDEVNVRHSIHLCIPILLGFYFSLRASKIDSDSAKSGWRSDV